MTNLNKLLYEACNSDRELLQEILEDYLFLRLKYGGADDLDQLETNLLNRQELLDSVGGGGVNTM